MPLVLSVQAPDASRHRLMLRHGQHARVGSGEWNEISVPQDDQLAEQHFLVRCESAALIQVDHPDLTLLVGGESVSEISFAQPVETTTAFVAGGTNFLARWIPELTPFPAVAAADFTPPSSMPPDQSSWIRAAMAPLTLSDAASALLQQPDQAVDYVNRLVQTGLHDDAVRCLAVLLQRTVAVHWALQASDVDEESPLVSAVLEWTHDNSEVNRVAVARYLETDQWPPCEYWLARAVLFSGGSLAPVDQPVIAPPVHLCGVALGTLFRFHVAASSDKPATTRRWIESGLPLLTDPSHTTAPPKTE